MICIATQVKPTSDVFQGNLPHLLEKWLYILENPILTSSEGERLRLIEQKFI